MKKLLNGLCVVVFAAVMCVAPQSAHAAAITLVTPGGEYPSNAYTLGFEFTVDVPILVSSLGVYDSGQDGIPNPADVAIWLSTGGAPLVSATVPSGVAGDLENFFRYTDISSLSLLPGINYVIGAYLPNGTASSFNTGQGGSGSVDPNVNIVRDRFSNFDSAFGFPTETNNNAGGAWLGANFRTEPASVPEPVALALLGLGLAGFGATRRRRPSR